MKCINLDLLCLLPLSTEMVFLAKKGQVFFEDEIADIYYIGAFIAAACLLVLVVLPFKSNIFKVGIGKNSQKEASGSPISVATDIVETEYPQAVVNEDFIKLVQLAKNNSMEFFTRFSDIYPDIVAEILEISPKLRVSELTLCAYIFLGFTTKEIAMYTYRSVNTVRNRRHNLRRKLNIPTEESMELWLKGLRKS